MHSPDMALILAEGLAYDKLAPFQGPSLLVYNDAVFNSEDFVSISQIGESVKRTQEGKTGCAASENTCVRLLLSHHDGAQADQEHHAGDLGLDLFQHTAWQMLSALSAWIAYVSSILIALICQISAHLIQVYGQVI